MGKAFEDALAALDAAIESTEGELGKLRQAKRALTGTLAPEDMQKARARARAKVRKRPARKRLMKAPPKRKSARRAKATRVTGAATAARSEKVLDLLRGEGALRTTEVAKTLGITRVAANQALLALEREGKVTKYAAPKTGPGRAGNMWEPR